jgi:hypothetical protein
MMMMMMESHSGVAAGSTVMGHDSMLFGEQ